MVKAAPGLYYRHLTIDQVLARQRERHIREVERHNAGVIEQDEPAASSAPSKRDQVLAEFGGLTRRWAR